MPQLLLLNDRSSYDLIANIEIDFSDRQRNTVQGQLFLASDRLFIKSYTKEPQILSKESCTEEFLIHGSTSDNDEKLNKFCGYLADRKKAAIVSAADGEWLFYLLPRDPHFETGTCIASYTFTSLSSTQSSKPVDISNPTNSIQKAVVSTSSSSSSQQASFSNTKGGNFLSNLMNKAKATQDVRNMPLNPIDEAKKQRVLVVENMMKKLREQFQSFVEDDSFLEYHLEPMEKELRYVV